MNDTIEPGGRRGRRLWLAGGIALTVVLLLTAIVSAAWVTINTNNNSVESTWGTPFYTGTCTKLANKKWEIKNAWVRNDGTSIYFRLETCAPAALTGNTNLRATGAIDCNLDGDFTDPYVVGPEGDRVVNYNPAVSPDTIVMLDGEGKATANYSDTYGERPTSLPANMEWKADLKDMPAACRGSSQPVNVSVVVIEVNESNGTYQVIDQSSVVQHSMPLDYGDAIDADEFDDCTEYRSRLKCNGARHGLDGTLRLGAAVDPDGGELYDAAASADDTTGATPDDEDGVWPTQGVNWTVGANGGSLDVTVSGGSGYLSCWIDWGNNSDFADAGDLVISNRAVSAGTAAQTFTVPGGVTFPNTFDVRCRVYPNSIASPVHTGPIEFGEVEDHQWAFGAGGAPPAPPALSPVAVTTLAIARDGASDVLLTWTHNPANQSYRVLRDATDPYFAPTEADDDLGVVSSAPWQKLDTGVYGAPAETYYYIVLGRVGSTESGPSNRVGLFEFDLTPGG